MGYSRKTGASAHLTFWLLGWLCVGLVIPEAAWARPFRYTAENTPLSVVLCAFAETQSKTCDVSSGIQGVVTGDLQFETPTAFYQFLERNQGIVSYQTSASISFYPRSEMRTEFFTVRNIGISSLRQALEEMGLYDRRYPLTWVKGGQMLKLTAPPAYVDVVAEVLPTLGDDRGTVRRSTKVFRLRNAWADDVTVDSMNKEVIIPGVASLLRRLTDEGAALPSAVGDGAPSVRRLRGQGLLRASGGTRNQALGNAPRGPRAVTAPPEVEPPQDAVRNKGLGARILADPRLNAVIVWDEEVRMPYYEKLIEELDVPVGLVEIRAAIVDVSINKLEELGISWGVNRRTRDGLSVIGGANVTSTADFESMEGSGLNISTIYTKGIDMLLGHIHALEQRGEARVLSRPAVLTMDNVQAMLEVTNTFYVQVPGAYEVDLFDVTYGTVLRVTPHIVRDSTGKPSVKLVVHIEDGGSRVAPKESGLTLPMVSRTTISTQAMVGESQALIIGGHYYESSTKGNSGVPILMNIPVLGALFSDRSDSRQKQERLFVISPRLVDIRDMPNRMNAVTTEEQARIQSSVERAMLSPTPPRSGCARSR